MALITTLIMLSVVTLMAVVFLAVSRRERASVGVVLDQTTAKLMAETALARAQAEVLARVTASSNLLAYDFMVSTNYLNPLGFSPTPRPDPYYVNYDHNMAGRPLNSLDARRNLANLKYDPRPPVVIVTNALTGSNEFRFYLDFNRNGRFDTNGWLIERDQRDSRILYTNFLVGDPEWIGVLDRPEYTHSGTNRFIGRYAYLILPAGKSLDLNFIHNQAKQLGPGNEGFYRNQGVGSWEINLAAFLRDLNTNFWGPSSYSYQRDLAQGSPAGAFASWQATKLLSLRYFTDYRNLAPVDRLFGPRGSFAFRRDEIDGYSDSMPGNADNDPTSEPWPGSDNPNAYAQVPELFSLPNLAPPPADQDLIRFTNRLWSAGTNLSYYDRYTFYRLISQLGVASKPALVDKVHINYAPDLFGNPTNFVNWRPIDFFTNAADRLLRTEFGLTLNYLPVWPTNFYTPAVHRLLQLTANIYDATTNRVVDRGYPHTPSVFRPVFLTTSSNVVITGYRAEENAGFMQRPWRDLNTATRPTVNPDDNVFGIPVVVGAKKGFPNFNEFALQTSIQVTRKLELRKPSLNALPTQTNQMYILGVSNLFGVEAWNSYSPQTYPLGFPRPLQLRVTNLATMVLVDSVTGERLVPPRNLVMGITTNIPANTWSGMGTARQFLLPVVTNEVLLPNAAYFFSRLPRFVPLTTNVPFEQVSGFPAPRWALAITNRMQYALIDSTTGRLVDYVNLGNMVSQINLTEALLGEQFQGRDPAGAEYWRTNIQRTLPEGVLNQLLASLGERAVPDWRSYSPQSPAGEDKQKAIDRFRVFVQLEPQSYPNEQMRGTNLQMQAPFTPTRKLVSNNSWQANDPLVHYLIEDLTHPQRTNDIQIVVPPDRSPTNSNLGQINERYQPWGGPPGKTASSDPNAFNLAVKDPLVRTSDDWDCPTNNFAHLGWLGRVHRGTPWQTVYLKSSWTAPQEWFKWSGDRFGYTHPTNDWRLLQHFTVAPNANAASGLLSVNQTNIAAWSAVLSGVMVLSNSVPDGEMLPQTPPRYTYTNVEPDSLQLKLMLTGVNFARFRERDGRFPHLGAMLAAPELTVRSPFLNLAPAQANYGISDAAYERIPQQILSLIKSDEPRLVIYAYGQSLKPAPDSLVLAPGTFYQMCTNYQITGEFVSRSVVRLEAPDGRQNNPRAVVESYQILPND